MTPADREPAGEHAALEDIDCVEATAVLRGRVVIARVRLTDGRRASWYFVLGLPPGHQPQQFHVVVDDDSR